MIASIEILIEQKQQWNYFMFLIYSKYKNYIVNILSNLIYIKRSLNELKNTKNAKLIMVNIIVSNHNLCLCTHSDFSGNVNYLFGAPKELVKVNYIFKYTLITVSKIFQV